MPTNVPTLVDGGVCGSVDSATSYKRVLVAGRILKINIMKKKLTITGIFNDVFTNYEDKESSVSITVDTEENCTCYKENGRCLIHFPPDGYVLTDVDEETKT